MTLTGVHGRLVAQHVVTVSNSGPEDSRTPLETKPGLAIMHSLKTRRYFGGWPVTEPKMALKRHLLGGFAAILYIFLVFSDHIR